MLDEYKQLYVENANLIPNWRELSKNDLANLYLENENADIANSYFSALICKFWNLIGSFYHKQGVKVASESDCYDWIVDGITKALSERAWKDSNNKLFDDPKGPEKAIMVCIMCFRANFYQYTKYDKRKLNYYSYSLDELEDNYSDGYFSSYEDRYYNITAHLKNIITEFLDKKDYVAMFLVDALYNCDITNNQDDDGAVNIKKFSKYLDLINDEYLTQFSEEYEIELEKVKSAFNCLQRLPHYKIHADINKAMNTLKKDDTLHSLLGE